MTKTNLSDFRQTFLRQKHTSRSDDSYGSDASWTAAADSLCNMDPSRIILENVGRNFHGNYSCQVAILQPIVNINLSLLIIVKFSNNIQPQ